MPDDFTDGEVLTAVDFNRVKNYWVSNTFPDAAVSAAAQDGDVVFVLDNADTVPNTLVALWDTDIDIENLATGQALVYDATAGMWSNTNVDVSSEISSLQSQIDSNSASISSLSTTVSGNTTSIANNTTNISSLSTTVSNLSTTVDTHTTQITALEEGGGGGGSATLWSGTVTGIINGDQQTVEVAAGEPINATIIAANKTPDFVYIDDKVIGGNLDGGYAILSREFNYPDMPAFDPTGGLTQNGAQQGLPVNNGTTNRLAVSGGGSVGQSEAVIAKYDSIAGDCYWNYSASATIAYYTSIADASFAGSVSLPEAIWSPISYAGYALWPTRGDNKTSRVWYWDWNVQDMGELLGLQPACDAIMADYAAADSSWDNVVSNGNALAYDTHLYVADDGKLNAIVGVSAISTYYRMVIFHLTYEYSSNPMSGTWTVQRHKETSGMTGDSTYFKPASDNTGTMYCHRSGPSGSSVSFYWWNWENDSLTGSYFASNYPFVFFGGQTCLGKSSARPYSVGTLYDNGTNLYLEFRDLKNESTSTIVLDAFPSATYETWTNTSSAAMRATQMRDGYLIACLRNKATDVYEFWKFDLFGQANKIGEGITPPPNSYTGHSSDIWSFQRGGSANSPTIAFFPPEDNTRSYSSSNWNSCSIYWVDGSA